MISEEKVSDLHELVRLFQHLDKDKDRRRVDGINLKNHEAENSNETELYRNKLIASASEVSYLHKRIDELLTKHDLKI